MSGSLRVVLFGCGRISERHAEVLTSPGLGEFELVGVCDVVAEKATRLGERFSVPSGVSLEGLVSQGVVFDLIAILTESGQHADHIVELSSWGLPLVVEKPLALSVTDVDRALTAVGSAGVELFEVKQNRYNPPIASLRGAVEAGKTGKHVLGVATVYWARDTTYYAEADWRRFASRDGGVVGNQAIHHLDLLLWLFGPVSTVHAVGDNFLVDIESEDTVVANLQFQSGALGALVATNAARPTNLGASLTAIFERGRVHIGGLAMNEIEDWTLPDRPQSEALRSPNQIGSAGVYGTGHHRFYQEVYNRLNGKPATLVEALEARRTVEVFEAIRRSILTDSIVRL